jgi:orotate phosphoribosyltransferase
MSVLNLLKETGAMLEGHFLLSSGLHSNKYFQCARLLSHPDKAAEALSEVAQKLLVDVSGGILPHIDAVVGPAIGGIVAAYELARQLNTIALFTERDDSGVMALRRGFEIAPAWNVIICEDVVTTGKSTLETRGALLKIADVNICAAACVVDRSGGDTRLLPFPLYSAVSVIAETWKPDICELCKSGIPAVKPGSRTRVADPDPRP